MTSRSFPFALPRGTDISGYVIDHVIGAGGFGITYAATNPVTGITVAVKEFFPQGCASREGAAVLLHEDVSSGSYEQALKKFEQEAAKLTARYRHPNIVQGINFLRANNTAYFIMEFVEGVSLEDWLAARPMPPSEAELRPLFEQVLDAVDYIHGRDGMHRDLTPRNIMVRNDGSAVLVDFGASGEGLDTDRGLSTAFAQPNYAPPEQLTGDDSRMQGRHTDIFSLGGVLYRAVTGNSPVKPLKRSHDVAMSGPSADPYVPARVAVASRQGYSAAFLSGIDEALRLDYRQRPPTITDLRRMLGWLDDVTALVNPAPADLTARAAPSYIANPSRVPPVHADGPATGYPDEPPRVAPAYGDEWPSARRADDDYDDVLPPDREFHLPRRSRGGLLLGASVFLATIVVGAVLWFAATGNVPFGALIADKTVPHAAVPIAPQVTAPPVKDAAAKQPRSTATDPSQEAAKEQIKQAAKEPVKDITLDVPALPAEPKKPVPKVDFTEFAGFSPIGKELTAPTPAPTNAEACRSACAENQQCRGFSMAGDSCSLYGDVTGLNPESDRKMSVRADAPGVKSLRQLVDLDAKRRSSFKKVDGITLPGGAPTAKAVVSQSQCRFSCLSDQTCKAYSFTSLVGACRLYTQVTPAQAKPAVGFVTQVDDPDGQITEQIHRAIIAKTRTFKSYTGLEFAAASARHAQAPDSATCRQSCLEDQTCVATTFAEGDCARFTDIETIHSRPTAETFVDVADTKLSERIDEEIKREAKGEAETFPGYDLIGTPTPTDRQRPTSSFDDCQAVCRETTGCTGYSYIYADSRCLTYSTVTDAIPDPGRSAGLFRGTGAATIELARRKIQQSEAQRASFRDIPGNCSPQGVSTSVQLPTHGASEQCAFLCRSGAGCQAWVFNRNDHTCALITSITGTVVTSGLVSGVLDPNGRRVGELMRSCGPIPPAALSGTPANECDRQAGYIYDPELPRGVAPKPFEHIDPSRALPACMRATENAPNVLRWRVELGRVVERDGRLAEARQIYRDAADDGSGPGAFLYAIMADRGQGGPQDDVEAERYFKLARSRGFLPATTALGMLYASSDRVTAPGDADALRLLEEAAQKGHGAAMYRLGEAYEKGRINRRTLPVDPAAAQQWYQRAFDAFRRDADAKDLNAYRFLSLQYDGGRGVPRDIDMALKYLVMYLAELYGPDNVIAQDRGTVGDLRLDDWSADTRKAFQQYLRDRGVFADQIDGNIGSRSIDAIDRWLGLRG